MLELFAITSTNLYRQHCDWAAGIEHDEQLDPEMLPLLRELNKLPGLNTLFSCHGHGKRGFHVLLAYNDQGGLVSTGQLMQAVKTVGLNLITPSFTELAWLHSPGTRYPALRLEAAIDYRSDEALAALTEQVKQLTVPQVSDLEQQLQAYGLSYPKDFPCGKQVGPLLYLHHDAARPYLDQKWQDYIDQQLATLPDSAAFVVKFNVSNYPSKGWINLHSLVESPDFNTAHEPKVGRIHEYYNYRDAQSGKSWGEWKITEPHKNYMVYHHKHLMVTPDYQGFDLDESRQRSLDCRQEVGKPDRGWTSRIGRVKFWHQWLTDHGLPV